MADEYTTEIQLGATYEDVVSGFKGVAIYVSFHLTGCTRVALEAPSEGKLEAYEFDETRVKLVSAPSKAIKSLSKNVREPATKPGGAATRARSV